MGLTTQLVAVTDNNFAQEVKASPLPVLVVFTATWCGPCKAIYPNLKHLADDMAKTLKVCTVDVDKGPELAEQYKIRSVPTILLFRKGEASSPHTGALTYAGLKGYVADRLED